MKKLENETLQNFLERFIEALKSENECNKLMEWKFL